MEGGPDAAPDQSSGDSGVQGDNGQASGGIGQEGIGQEGIGQQIGPDAAPDLSSGDSGVQGDNGQDIGSNSQGIGQSTNPDTNYSIMQMNPDVDVHHHIQQVYPDPGMDYSIQQLKADPGIDPGMAHSIAQLNPNPDVDFDQLSGDSDVQGDNGTDLGGNSESIDQQMNPEPHLGFGYQPLDPDPDLSSASQPASPEPGPPEDQGSPVDETGFAFGPPADHVGESDMFRVDGDTSFNPVAARDEQEQSFPPDADGDAPDTNSRSKKELQDELDKLFKWLHDNTRLSERRERQIDGSAVPEKPLQEGEGSKLETKKDADAEKDADASEQSQAKQDDLNETIVQLRNGSGDILPLLLQLVRTLQLIDPDKANFVLQYVLRLWGEVQFHTAYLEGVLSEAGLSIRDFKYVERVTHPHPELHGYDVYMSYDYWLYYNRETGDIRLEPHRHGHGEMIEALPLGALGGKLGKALFGKVLSKMFARTPILRGSGRVERGLKALLMDEAGSIKLNKEVGDTFRDEIADLMEKELKGKPGHVISKEVYKRTPHGPASVDVQHSVLGEDFLMHLGGLETKVGGSRYRPWQRLKHLWLRSHGYPVELVRKPK